MKWSPIETAVQRPAAGQRVFYFFAPSGHWFVGEYNGAGMFHGRHGFCDHHDATHWHPEPPPPANAK